MNSVNPLPTSACQPSGRAEREELQEVFLTPAVDIAEGTEGYWLQAEMPGVPREGLQVTLEGDRLIVLGRRLPRRTAGEAVHRESSAGAFRRAFVLHPGIDLSRIEARLEDGVLSVHLPKAETVKPRRIPVHG